MVLTPQDPIWTPQPDPPLPSWVKGFRDTQLAAVEEILDAYRRGVQVVMLDAPTGAGKTLIAEMVRRRLCEVDEGRVGVKGVYVCHTKGLQDQFLSDFPYSDVLKGRANYPTEKMGDAVSAAECTGAKCKWCHSKATCPYVIAKKQAMKSRVAVVNSAYLLAESNSSEQAMLAHRPWIVVDECDTLESVLMGQMTTRISARAIDELGMERLVKGARIKTVRGWLREMEEKVQGKVDGYVVMGVAENGTAEQVKELNRWRRMLGKVQGLKRDLEEVEEEEEGDGSGGWGVWVRDYEKNRRGEDEGHVVMKPVTVDRFAKSGLWDHASRWLLMSATIISADEQAMSLGLDQAGIRWELVTVPMTWDVGDREIRYKPVVAMTYANGKDAWKKMEGGVEEVLEKEGEVNTLVHTVSYPFTRWLAEELTGRHPASGKGTWRGRKVWWYTDARDRDTTIERFKEEGGVLLAPSADRGVDLPGDLCRCQIVTKIPYPSLGDKQVSARLRVPGGQVWYAAQVARTLVQMTGRGVRFEGDQCRTWILDQQFGRWWSGDGKKLLPKWWKEALVL